MSSSSLEKNMRKTAEEFVLAWHGNWTVETNKKSTSFRAPGCKHIMLPASLEIPTRSNSEWSAYFEHLHGAITDCNMEILDYLGVPSERRAVLHSRMEATSRVGPFKNEYVWFLSFDETGEKITEIKEFLDSHATKTVRERLNTT